MQTLSEKSYSYDDVTLDIVTRKDFFGGTAIRIYLDKATINQCTEIVRISSPILDDSITEEEIQETLNYITERKETNGYYYADLSLLLLGNDIKGYELILKLGND